MSSKFSGILAQARKRQNDEDEIDVVEAGEDNEVKVAPEPKVEVVETPAITEPPVKTAIEKSVPKPKATPKAKAPIASAQPPLSRAVPEAPVVEEAARRGRPQGKRSDPNYTQITAYITKATHRSVKLALLERGDGQEISEVIEECLRDWVAKQK